MAVRTVSPRHAMSCGRPTFTDRSRGIEARLSSLNPSSKSIVDPFVKTHNMAVSSGVARRSGVCELREALQEVIPPRFGQRFHRHHASQQVQVVLVFPVKACNIRHLHFVFVTVQQPDGLSSSHLALLEHREVEPRQLALQKSLEDVVAPKLEAELIARQPGLRHHHVGGSDLKMIANMHGFVQQTLDREVLAEHPPGQSHLRKLLPPERVVLPWIGINSLLRSAVDREVRLAVTLKVEPPDGDAA